MWILAVYERPSEEEGQCETKMTQEGGLRTVLIHALRVAAGMRGYRLPFAEVRDLSAAVRLSIP
jgi:hypothetical protein